MPDTLVPILEAFAILGIGKSSGYAGQRAGTIPPTVHVGRKSTLPSEEVEAIRRARIRGATDDDLRELVIQLVAARGQDAEKAEAARAARSKQYRQMGLASVAKRQGGAAAGGSAI